MGKEVMDFGGGASPVEKNRRKQQGILVVDDEPGVLRYTQKTLQRFGYKVFVASNGFDAVTLFKKHTDEIDTVLLDVSMPKKNGVETYHELVSIDPKISVVFMSGYAGNHLDDLNRLESFQGFIAKPFTPLDLIEKLKAIKS